MRPLTAVLAAALAVPVASATAVAAPTESARYGENVARWLNETLSVVDRENDSKAVHAEVDYHGSRTNTRHLDTYDSHRPSPEPSRYEFSTAAFRAAFRYRVCERVGLRVTGCGRWTDIH